MKSLRMAFLLSVAMMSAFSGAVNIEDYLNSNLVDAQGNTILHVLVENAHDDNFTIELKPFVVAHNLFSKQLDQFFKLTALVRSVPREERQNALMVGLEKIEQIRMDFIAENSNMLVAIDTPEKLFYIKNNNGETILDIARRMSATYPDNKRCQFFKNVLEILEEEVRALY